jgi:hypothetical protein
MSDTTIRNGLFPVIHPLDDVREEKLYRPELGRLHMTWGVRTSLVLLQAYLASMLLLVAWRVLTGL